MLSVKSILSVWLHSCKSDNRFQSGTVTLGAAHTVTASGAKARCCRAFPSIIVSSYGSPSPHRICDATHCQPRAVSQVMNLWMLLVVWGGDAPAPIAEARLWASQSLLRGTYCYTRHSPCTPPPPIPLQYHYIPGNRGPTCLKMRGIFQLSFLIELTVMIYVNEI